MVQGRIAELIIVREVTNEAALKERFLGEDEIIEHIVVSEFSRRRCIISFHPGKRDIDGPMVYTPSQARVVYPHPGSVVSTRVIHLTHTAPAVVAVSR